MALKTIMIRLIYAGCFLNTTVKQPFLIGLFNGKMLRLLPLLLADIQMHFRICGYADENERVNLMAD
jgi:hypothetical protein